MNLDLSIRVSERRRGEEDVGSRRSRRWGIGVCRLAVSDTLMVWIRGVGVEESQLHFKTWRGREDFPGVLQHRKEEGSCELKVWREWPWLHRSMKASLGSSNQVSDFWGQIAAQSNVTLQNA